MNKLVAFMCSRGVIAKTVKVQLEIKPETLEAFKQHAAEFQRGNYTPKQIMENILNNWADGTVGK